MGDLTNEFMFEQNEKKEKKIKKLKKKYKALNEYTELCRDTLRHKDMEIDLLQGRVSALEKLNEQLKNDNEQLKKDNKTLEAQFSSLKLQLVSVQMPDIDEINTENKENNKTTTIKKSKN